MFITVKVGISNKQNMTFYKAMIQNTCYVIASTIMVTVQRKCQTLLIYIAQIG
jgi:hypothetical protein